MSVNRQVITLPSFDKRAIIFRAVETVLRTDKDLGNVIKTWATWEGKASDIAPISASLCPYLRMTLVGSSITRAAVDTLWIPVGISIEVASPGTCLEDFSGLWGCLENALVGSKIFNPETQQSVFIYLKTCCVDAYGNQSGAFDFKFTAAGIEVRNMKALAGGLIQAAPYMIGAGVFTAQALKRA